VKHRIHGVRLFMCATLVLGRATLGSSAQETTVPAPSPPPPGEIIDLPSSLQLAGARNLDIQIAREKLAEAQANRESSVWQFFPSITPGVGYRRHDNLIQTVDGNLINVHTDSYAVGPVIAAQVDLGGAIYRNLAARQLVKAAELGLESQRQDTILAAAIGYFDLAKAQAAAEVTQEAVSISQDYAGQVQRAVEVGIAFKGDALRAQVQVERNRLTLRQTQEEQRVASARLAQTLHLAAGVTLVPRDAEMLPLELVATNAGLMGLVAQAFSTRPELAQNRFLIEAARDARKGAKYGPLIPSLGAEVFVGGLGGGNATVPDQFGQSQDYAFTLGWRIGPGGLFDRGRIRAADARLKVAELTDEKWLDEVVRQVTESFTRWQSATDQLSTVRRAVQAATETLQLTRQRKEFAVGAVLENIQSEQELTRARLDFVNAIAEYNKAQFSLKKSIGGLQSGRGPDTAKTDRTSPGPREP
jgi:outer membrane protein TolC